jgi:5-formyltetrahydrofolate cyclo-ligase
MTKSAIRTNILSIRNALPLAKIQEISMIIQKKVIESRYFQDAKIIHIYKHFGSEVRTDYIIKQALETCKIVVITQTLPKSQLKHWEIFIDTVYTKDKYGIDFPTQNCTEFDIKTLTKNDLVLVPLVAFDSENNRIGYGGGYYDRFLSQCLGYKIGLGYECQKVNKIEPQEFDVALDSVISEG